MTENPKVSDDERENMDVASLMYLTAEKETLDAWTAKLLQRAATLLSQTTKCCHAMAHVLEEEYKSAEKEKLLEAILKEEEDDETV